MLQLLLNIIFFLIFIYLAFGVLYLLFISIAGVMRKKNVYTAVIEKRSIAVIIPSYKEDNIILDTASRAVNHNYPKNKFKVFIVADHLLPETIIKLRAVPVEVIEVQFDISTKAKSLNAALNKIDGERFDIVMILDADNVMKEECLESVNAAFEEGALAVQCHRAAKNQHSPVAVLDAISEEINNHLFRKGQRALGISATLIGSGMAFRFTDIHSIFNTPHILTNPGEDREVDIQLMLKGVEVEYADDAIVYDEKVSSSAVFEKQRVRWLEAQLNHFKRFLQADVRKAKKNLNYWSKFIQTILLPRSLYILSFCLFILLITVQRIFHFHFLYPASTWWAILMILFLTSLMLAVPRIFYNANTGRALLHLPALILRMFKAVLRIKSNRTEFLHTPKTYTS
jgi:cellulose synthase/poly-beta-1,6-N-acetylglucosamine synthase-like glycosyltransferase